MPTKEIVRLDELENYRRVRGEAAEFIGSVAVGNIVEITQQLTFDDSRTLFESIKQAKKGDVVALRRSEANVGAAIVESAYKTGNVVIAETSISDDARWSQFDQGMFDVFRNSLKHKKQKPELRKRTEIETEIGFFTYDLIKNGTLRDYCLLVDSCVPDNVSVDEAFDDGFFTDKMSACFQLITVTGGKCVTESAFVAGSTGKGEPRFDLRVMAELYKALGTYNGELSATDFLASPRLIRKDLLPNGVVDLVRLYDKVVAELLGHKVFFGERCDIIPDYVEFRSNCAIRQEKLQTVIKTVLSEMLDNADRLKKPYDAIELLQNLTREHIVRRSMTDHSIDPTIFGEYAATLVFQARHYHELGLAYQAESSINDAKLRAHISMCGIGSKSDPEGSLSKREAEFKRKEVNPDNSDESENDESSGDHELIECPQCRRLVLRETAEHKDWGGKVKTLVCAKADCGLEYDVCMSKEVKPSKYKAKREAIAA